MNQSEFRSEKDCMGWFKMSWQRKRAHKRARIRAQIVPASLGISPERIKWPYCFMRGIDLIDCLVDTAGGCLIRPERLYIIADSGKVHADPWRINSLDIFVSWSRVIQHPNAFYMDSAYCNPLDFGIDPEDFEFRFRKKS